VPGNLTELVQSQKAVRPTKITKTERVDYHEEDVAAVFKHRSKPPTSEHTPSCCCCSSHWLLHTEQTSTGAPSHNCKPININQTCRPMPPQIHLNPNHNLWPSDLKVTACCHSQCLYQAQVTFPLRACSKYHRYKQWMEHRQLVSTVGSKANICTTGQGQGQYGISRTWPWSVNMTGR